jgi:N-acetyl sugar amidotransferase
MNYCRSCLTPDTRPNGRFNSQGICLPCEFTARGIEENYEKRLEDLKQIVHKLTRTTKKSRWQCIIGISGGKDSTRQALWAREKLGVNPLLVSIAYPPKQISYVGAHNLSNLIDHGFDTMVIGPAPVLSKDLVREAFLRFCNWCKATEMALFSGVPRVAIQKGIPLIFWGENPALQVGDTGTLATSIWDGNNLVNSNTLAGGNLDWFTEVAGSASRLEMYRFPDREQFRKHRIQTIFLGPAWKDWSGETNSRVALANGLQFRGGDPRASGDILGTSMVDEDWTIVNMLLKYYKFGFSRGTEYANELIRSGIVTREEAIHYAELDEGCDDCYIESFCKYIDLPVSEFWATVRKFANPVLFDLSGSRPRKKFTVGKGLNDA